MTNRLKNLLDSGKTAMGAQMRLGSPAAAELFGYAGFDFVLIDGEHAAQSPVSVQAQLQAIGCTDATPLVRLVSNDPDQIRLALDIGGMGVVIPFINTAEQATVGAKACRYPPAGTRGVGASRGAKYGFDSEYVQTSNDNVLYVPIIESADAVKNIDEILAVEGVDSFLLGLGDLSVSFGVPFQIDHPVMQDALRTVVRAAEAAGKPAGIGWHVDFNDPDASKFYLDAGFKLLLLACDEVVLAHGSRQIVASFEALRG